MLRIAGRLLIIGLTLSVGVLLTGGMVGVLVLFLAALSRLLFPNGIGPEDDILGLFSSTPPSS